MLDVKTILTGLVSTDFCQIDLTAKTRNLSPLPEMALPPFCTDCFSLESVPDAAPNTKQHHLCSPNC
jgi:hypothetical protein